MLNLGYGFTASDGSNNGNLVSLVSSATQVFMRTYTYDELNRLSTMSSPADPSGCTGLSWTYDAWANRTNQTTTSGACTESHPVVGAIGANNRFTVAPYQYDAAGNMTQDASHAYTYDAENRLTQVDGTAGNCSTATACYAYDASGQRIRKVASGATTDYVYDNTSGTVAAETQGSTWTTGYVYAGGGLLAEYNGAMGASGSTTLFVHKDHLGSTRVMTAMNGTVSDSMDYLPYGEQIAGGSTTTHKFTGKERDGESGLDNFGARYYSSSLGRFVSADWSATPEPVPYAKPVDPQTLNLYAYVRNNPITLVDPAGHDPKGIVDILISGPNHVNTKFDDAKNLGPAQTSDGAFLNLNVKIAFDEGDNLSDYKTTRVAVVLTEQDNNNANRDGERENPDKDQVANEGSSKYVYDGPGKHPDFKNGVQLPEASINAGYDAVFKITEKNTKTGVTTDLYYRVQFVIEHGKIVPGSINKGTITKDDYERKKKQP